MKTSILLDISLRHLPQLLSNYSVAFSGTSFFGGKKGGKKPSKPQPNTPSGPQARASWPALRHVEYYASKQDSSRWTIAWKTLFFAFLIGLSLPLFAQELTVGLLYQDSLAARGYTLFIPTSSRTTYLIDNCGQEVNRWESTYLPGVIAYLLEDGSLLRTGKVPNNNFNGGGAGGQLERYDWDRNLIWSYRYSNDQYQQHHDVEYLPNGNIMVLAWDFMTTAEALQAGRDPAFLGPDGLWLEKLAELRPIGTDSIEVVWEWRLIHHLIQDFDSTKDNYGVIAEHPGKVDINFLGEFGVVNERDWIHANAVDYNAERDELMINSRQLGEFWIIDHSVTTAEAATDMGGNRGKGGQLLYRWGNPQAYGRGTEADQRLFGPHDAQWIPSEFPGGDNIMVYNNGSGRTDSLFSSVEVIAPPLDASGNYVIGATEAFGPDTLAWVYPEVPDLEFYSRFISGANRLPNGNTLICEGREGRIFEVGLDGSIHWEYVNPVGIGGPVSQGNTPNGSDVFRAYRYGGDYPAFQGRNLVAGAPIEFNPVPNDCESLVSIDAPDFSVQIGPNPFRDQLLISGLELGEYEASVYSTNGQQLLTSAFSGTQSVFNTEAWPNGMYVLQLKEVKSGKQVVRKVVK